MRRCDFNLPHRVFVLQNEYREYSKMGKFLRKMNLVDVQNVCLKTEKAKLSRDNVQLKHCIKRCLTELVLKNEKQRPFSVKLQSETLKPEKLKMYVCMVFYFPAMQAQVVMPLQIPMLFIFWLLKYLNFYYPAIITSLIVNAQNQAKCT